MAAHKASEQLIALVTTLLGHGWLSTRQLAEKADVPRSTARAILDELASRAWVERRVGEGETLWCLGPELPRIGLAYQRQLVAEAELLERRMAHTLGQVAWDAA